MKKLLIIPFIFLFVLLCACGSAVTETESEPETVYVPEFHRLEAGFQFVDHSLVLDRSVYMLSTYISGTETVTDLETGLPAEQEVTSTGLFRVGLDGGEVERLAYTVPDSTYELETERVVYVDIMFTGADGDLYLAEHTSVRHYNLPDGFDERTDYKMNYLTGSESFIEIVCLENDGSERGRIDISGVGKDEYYFKINSLTTDEQGNFYLGSEERLYVLSPDGEVTANVDEGWPVMNLSAASDGRIYAMSSGKLKQYNAESKSLKAVEIDYIDVPVACYSGGGSYPLYVENRSGLFGVNPDTGAVVKLFEWVNCDIISVDILCEAILPDGEVVCLQSADYGEQSVFELAVITARLSSEISEKEIIRLACCGTDRRLKQAVVRFNKLSTDYRVQVTDYSEYNTKDNPNGGAIKLGTDIATGNAPDIFGAEGMSIRQLSARGFLEDLWPYIDADEELGGREAMVLPVFEALSENGRLYEICPNFMLEVYAGDAAVVGSVPGWSFSDVRETLRAMPGAEVFANITRDTMLERFCEFAVNDFIDWNAGTCDFDSQELIDILDYISTFPEELTGEYMPSLFLVTEGRQLLYENTFINFGNYSSCLRDIEGDVNLIGFPVRDGIGNAFITDGPGVTGGLAMSSASSCKEGAWAFMRTMLSEEYQTSVSAHSLPTNKAALEALAESDMAPNYYTDRDTGELINTAVTQEEYEAMMELINSTTRVSLIDDNIIKIFRDACAPFFAGETNASDAAERIQGRMSIYVGETG